MNDNTRVSSHNTNQTPKWQVHIEVRLKPRSNAHFNSIRTHVLQHITQDENLYIPSTITGWDTHAILKGHVELIKATESTFADRVLPVDQAVLKIHVYQPTESDEFEEFTSGGSDGEDLMAATVCELPCRAWEGLWESLVYTDNIKPKLLNYIQATLLFSDADVDFNILSWNRVVLLHGPPGTGKTSLCRALAQKLSIRLCDRYTHSKFIEINSHSLFSRWFSESGKLVQKLFASVTEMIEDETSFVVVLIDEVESLTAARAGAMSGTEPTDALRVVNALLTQLDKLKQRRNVLVMSTSNLAQAIDSAYVDRADIVQYVGLPATEAVYTILASCINELGRTGIVSPVDILDAEFAKECAQSMSGVQRWNSDHSSEEDEGKEVARRVSARLFKLAEKCQGLSLSGRFLRRLPVLAHANYIGHVAAGESVSDAEVWLTGMEKVVEQHILGEKSKIVPFA